MQFFNEYILYIYKGYIMKNISLNTIFSNWYKDVYRTAQDSATQSVSIFSHTSEFKEFLVCEMDVDSSIYSKSLVSIKETSSTSVS